MNYKEELPEFMAKNVTNLVNKRFDITENQSDKLKEIKEHLNIPPSSIVRIALDTFLPKTKNNYFRYAGIMDVWNNTKF